MLAAIRTFFASQTDDTAEKDKTQKSPPASPRSSRLHP